MTRLHHNNLSDVDLIYVGDIIDLPETPVEPPRNLRWRYTSSWASSFVAVRQQAADEGWMSPPPVVRPPPPPPPKPGPSLGAFVIPRPDPGQKPPPCAADITEAAASGDLKLRYVSNTQGLEASGIVNGERRTFRVYVADDGLVIDRSNIGATPITLHTPTEWAPTVQSARTRMGSVWTGGAVSGMG